jgi:hypothetical protein
VSPELFVGLVTVVVNAGLGLRAIQVLGKRVDKVESTQLIHGVVLVNAGLMTR